MPAIKPGNLNADPDDFSGFAGSMAEQIEQELNTLLATDGLPTLPSDPGDREVRDRRRLFIAIARAVVRHLRDNNDAIDIVVPDGVGGSTTVNPSFTTTGL